MKKVFALLAFSAILVNCQKKPDTPPAETTSETAKKDSAATVKLEPSPSLEKIDKCVFFNPLNGLTIPNQIEWLLKNETKICASDELKICITDLHHMKQEDYDFAVKAYWGNNPPKFTEITLDNFVSSTIPCTYSSYCVFDADANDNISFTKQSSFSTTLTSYSIPFFQGLAARYNLTGSSKLLFTKAIVNSQTVIVVSVSGVTDANFDYSHYPGGKAASSNPVKDKEYRSPQLRQSYGQDS
jgi:hypothetical protein